MQETEYINVYGARVHNLKDIDAEIPRNSLTVITGLSGSGKSSLAFDTIFAEGQRRYIETFSAYARNFLGNLERPDVDKITGLSPVISIEQKTTNKNRPVRRGLSDRRCDQGHGALYGGWHRGYRRRVPVLAAPERGLGQAERLPGGRRRLGGGAQRRPHGGVSEGGRAEHQRALHHGVQPRGGGGTDRN